MQQTGYVLESLFQVNLSFNVKIFFDQRWSIWHLNFSTLMHGLLWFLLKRGGLPSRAPLLNNSVTPLKTTFWPFFRMTPWTPRMTRMPISNHQRSGLAKILGIDGGLPPIDDLMRGQIYFSKISLYLSLKSEGCIPAH